MLTTLWLACALFAQIALGKGKPPKFNWDDTKYVYAFGDSYTFVQGTEGHYNFSFISDAFNQSFTPQQLLNDEIVWRYTSSDGANWIEYLTGCFYGKPSDCFPHQLWDFAFAGADITKALLPLHHNFSVDLVDEVNQWAKYAAHVIPHPPSETITFWWIGINDTGDAPANTTDFHAFWEEEMNYYFEAVNKAYQTGLAGTYFFINVPPEQRSPIGLSGSPASQATGKQHIDDFNSVLASYIKKFESQHSDVNVMTFDANTWFNNILDNHGEYGFTNITGFCECTDDSFFWFNTGHPTEKVHYLLSQAIEEQLLKASIY